MYSCPNPRAGRKPLCPGFMFSCGGTSIRETHSFLYPNSLLPGQRSISIEWERDVWLSPSLSPLTLGSTCLQKAQIPAVPCHQSFLKKFLLEYSRFYTVVLVSCHQSYRGCTRDRYRGQPLAHRPLSICPT